MSTGESAREPFNKVKDKSDDDYEKNIVYIAAGTLVLSMTFLEKIIKVETSKGIWVLIFSWSFLAITLLINLVSHQLSSRFSEICGDLFDECDGLLNNEITVESNVYKESREVAINQFNRYNAITRLLNWTATATLFIGIGLMVIFCSMNAIYAKNQNELNQKNKIDSAMSKEITPKTMGVDTTKGRTMSPPVRPASQPANTSTGNSNQGNSNGNQNNQGGK